MVVSPGSPVLELEPCPVDVESPEPVEEPEPVDVLVPPLDEVCDGTVVIALVVVEPEVELPLELALESSSAQPASARPATRPRPSTAVALSPLDDGRPQKGQRASRWR